MDEWIVWALFSGLLLLGMVGVVMPVIPGPVLIVVAAVMHKVFLPEYLSWWTVAFVALGAIICYALDAICLAFGVKWTGASKWAFLGAALGFLLGLFVPFPGLLLGPVIGATMAELIFAKRHLSQASLTGAVAGLSVLVSSIIHIVIVLLMISVVVVDALISWEMVQGWWKQWVG